MTKSCEKSIKKYKTVLKRCLRCLQDVCVRWQGVKEMTPKTSLKIEYYLLNLSSSHNSLSGITQSIHRSIHSTPLFAQKPHKAVEPIPMMF